MDKNTFLQLDLNDLSNITDQELGATKVFSTYVVNYNRETEFLQTLGELGFELGADQSNELVLSSLGLEGIKRHFDLDSQCLR